MPDRAAAEAFIDAYRRTFETFDVAAIAACYAFPVQVVGEADGVSVVSIPSRGWIPRWSGSSARTGCWASRAPPWRGSTSTEVTPGIAHATVTWSLHTASGDPVYDFTASYTLADLPEGTRIVVIAHDETPKLLAAVARARGA